MKKKSMLAVAITVATAAAGFVIGKLSGDKFIRVRFNTKSDEEIKDRNPVEIAESFSSPSHSS